MRTLATILLLAAPGLIGAAENVNERLDAAAEVFADMTNMPDKGIPQDLLEKSRCVVIVPGLKKGAFVVGAKYGKGFVTCRDAAGKFGAPAAIRVEGGSVGFQIGGSEADVVMLVMNSRGAEKFLNDQFTLGGEGEVAAGPVGRNATAQTDAMMHAEMLSWSRTRGVFAGISLQGATLRSDKEGNTELYGKAMTGREIIHGNMTAPAAAGKLLNELNQYPQRAMR